MVERNTVRGLREAQRVLKQLPKKAIGRVLDNALRAGATIIKKEAQRRVHVRTGDLKDSIAVATGKKKQRAAIGAGSLVHVGFRPPHSRRAHLEEFGTSKTPAHPFMRPAAETTKGQVIIKVGERLGKRTEAEAKKLAGPLFKRAKSRR